MEAPEAKETRAWFDVCAHRPRDQERPEALPQTIGYLSRERRRMDYAASRKAGYPTGSGTIASRCKVVVQERMAPAGMRRNRPGAQAMLALLSDFWQYLAPASHPILGANPPI